MVGLVVVTRAARLIARRASTWTIEEHLGGRSPGRVISPVGGDRPLISSKPVCGQLPVS